MSNNKFLKPEHRHILLNRRMDRAYNYAVSKGLSPVEYMRVSIDRIVQHLMVRGI